MFLLILNKYIYVLVEFFLKCLFEGFGVFIMQQFIKGSFFLEYVGERIIFEEVDEREKRKKNGYCYVYYFKWNGMCWQVLKNKFDIFCW